ncbi:MAG TPA: DUF5698 domain-containing protein [Dehalococcoidia bacterium]|nr:DUF5698 domain-containing protein [Dehalococcoidia bacterium]
MLEPIGIALLVMLLRATDVSLATLKTIFIIEGRNGLAPALGFFEATIYVIAASLVFRDLGNPFTIAGFGAGFAMGTALGMFLAGKLGLGSVTVRFTKSGDAWALTEALREAAFPLTTFSGGGRDGPVSVIQLNVRKRKVPQVLDVARPWLGECFVTVGDEPVQASSAPAVIETLRRAPGVSWALVARKVHP